MFCWNVGNNGTKGERVIAFVRGLETIQKCSTRLSALLLVGFVPRIKFILGYNVLRVKISLFCVTTVKRIAKENKERKKEEEENVWLGFELYRFIGLRSNGTRQKNDW